MADEARVVTVQDIARLPKRQQDVLSLICINEDEGHHPATLQALLRRGLIEEYEDRLAGVTEPVLLAVRVKHYRAPIAVHIAWCAWCCTQELEDD